jgi:hypothetical protein
MEAFDVLQLAGCESPTVDEQRVRRFTAEQLAQVEQLQREEEQWRLDRSEELDRIHRSRAARRQHLESTDDHDVTVSRRLSTQVEGQEEVPFGSESVDS